MSYLRNISLVGGLVILGMLLYSPLISWGTTPRPTQVEEVEEEEEEEVIVNELACVTCGEPGRKRMNKDAHLVVSCRKCWAEVDETEEDVWSSVLRKNITSTSE
jgi:hypothetical protein